MIFLKQTEPGEAKWYPKRMSIQNAESLKSAYIGTDKPCKKKGLTAEEQELRSEEKIRQAAEKRLLKKIVNREMETRRKLKLAKKQLREKASNKKDRLDKVQALSRGRKKLENEKVLANNWLERNYPAVAPSLDMTGQVKTVAEMKVIVQEHILKNHKS